MARRATCTVEMKGLDRFIRRFNVAAAQLQPALAAAIWQEANVIADKADMLVPVDLGTLALSQIVHDPVMQGSVTYVDITYGGPAAPYAEVQHENESFSHPSEYSGLPPNGRQAKYLEEPFDDAVGDGELGGRLAARIEDLLIGRMSGD